MFSFLTVAAILSMSAMPSSEALADRQIETVAPACVDSTQADVIEAAYREVIRLNHSRGDSLGAYYFACGEDSLGQPTDPSPEFLARFADLDVSVFPYSEYDELAMWTADLGPDWQHMVPAGTRCSVRRLTRVSDSDYRVGVSKRGGAIGGKVLSMHVHRSNGVWGAELRVVVR